MKLVTLPAFLSLVAFLVSCASTNPSRVPQQEDEKSYSSCFIEKESFPLRTFENRGGGKSRMLVALKGALKDTQTTMTITSLSFKYTTDWSDTAVETKLTSSVRELIARADTFCDELKPGIMSK